MDYAEFVEWYAFYASEPFGMMRAEITTARHMALLANIYRDPEKRPQPFELTDFLPDWWHEREVATGPSVAEKFRMASDVINARNET